MTVCGSQAGGGEGAAFCACPGPGGRTEPEPRCRDRDGTAMFIQQKPFIHSKINHWVYSADIKKSGEGGKASVTVPLC